MTTVKKIVREPIGDIEPADVTIPPIKDAEVLTFGKAKYEEVGTCQECGTKVYKWIDNGHQNHAAIGSALVVYVAFSHRNPPGLYCQRHDPNAGHRAATGKRQEGQPIDGDTWRPAHLGSSI